MRFQDVYRRNRIAWWLFECLPRVVFAVVVGLAVLWAVGVRGQDLRGLTREEAFNINEANKARQHLLDRAKNGPLPWEQWCIAQLENGVIKSVITKPANAQKLLVGDAFLQMHSHQRDQLITWLCQESYVTKQKKPLAVPVYLTAYDGKQGKKIGSFRPDNYMLTLTVKARPDSEWGDITKIDLFKPPAK